MSIVDKELERMDVAVYRREWQGDVSDLNNWIYEEEIGSLDANAWEKLYAETDLEPLITLARELERHCEAMARYIEADYESVTGHDLTGGVLTAWQKFKQERRDYVLDKPSSLAHNSTKYRPKR